MLQNFGPRQINLKAREAEDMAPQLIAITSGKGGVGKTSLSVNLALLLRKAKKRVLLVDADIHLGNVDLIMGIRPRYTVADVIKDGISLEEVITRAPGDIDILPASSAVSELLEMNDLVIQRLSDAFSAYELDYDYILLDTGAGISQIVMSFVLSADKVVLVVTSDPASIADAYAMIKTIRIHQPDLPILMVANMVRSDEEGESIYKKMNLMVKKFLKSSIDFGGVIIRDDLVSKSVKLQRPFVMEYPNSVATSALRLVNRRLVQLPILSSGKRVALFRRFLENRKIELKGTE